MKESLYSWVPRSCGAVMSMIVLFTAVSSSAQTVQAGTLKQQAVTEFKNANYPAAIDLLERALVESPQDPELHYYLGYFNHYMCYDSVPLRGYDRHHSDAILSHLQRAIELNPDYGDAYYYIGAEYGARSIQAMQSGDDEGVAEELLRGKIAGGYPDWLLEFGRNTLRSCASNALLITGGDADTDAVWYAQRVEGFRTDVTVMATALLDHPWFVALLKHGREGILHPAPIDWSDEQIASMHPYKWKTNTIKVPIPESAGAEYGIESTILEWQLSPDLGCGEGPNLLRPGRALFADIVQSNRWERPIHFSLGCSPDFWAGLDSYLQVHGITQRLLPAEPPTAVDSESTRRMLLQKENFRSLPTLADRDMPRASRLLQNYRACYLRLIIQDIQNKETEKAKELLAAMKQHIPEDILPLSEQHRDSFESLVRILE